MNFWSEFHLMDVLFKFNLVLVTIQLALFALSLVVELLPLVSRIADFTGCFVAGFVSLACRAINARLESTFIVLWVFHILLSLLILAFLLVLSPTRHQVITIVFTDVDLFLFFHLFENLLALAVDVWLSGELIILSVLCCQSFLLSLKSLHEYVICAVGTELLVSLVHLGHLKCTQHVIAGLLVNSSDQAGIRIGHFGGLASWETQYGCHEHSQMGHNDTLSIVSFFLALASDRLQMLPNGLDSLKLCIAAGLDEAHVDHDLSHCYLGNRCVFVDFKLAQHFIQVLFKSFH